MPRHPALLDALATERSLLLAVAHTAPTAALWPDDGSWGVGHALAHIPAMEAWLVSPMEHHVDELEFMDDARRDELTAPLIGQPLERLLEELAQRRERTIEVVESTDELNVTLQTQWGDRTRLQLARMIYRHDREHCAQITELSA